MRPDDQSLIILQKKCRHAIDAGIDNVWDSTIIIPSK